MTFREDLSKRILILDGAMGTMIQERGLYGDNELLNLTHPEVIAGIHDDYIAAGADIIETNSFGANSISQQEYGHAGDAFSMAFESARIARRSADAAPRKVWVAGCVGPTGRSLTLASDASDPAFRRTGFDEMQQVYAEQIRALVEGGVDIILLETWFDALNAKAAIKALEAYDIPVIISATVSDRSGRTLTGQTLEAFFTSVRHCPGLCAFGLNCALGAESMTGLVEEISAFSPLPLIFYPNAGIPDEMGRYNDSPQRMAKVMGNLASKGLLNIAGGCCGSTAEHVRAISDAVRSCKPRVPGPQDGKLVVSGLEAVGIGRGHNFTNIGERTNVAGSRKFARLIGDGSYEEALEVAAGQIEGGADIIDINMDDAMLDSTVQMRVFLRHIAGDPAVAKAALMIDSSHFDTILEGLRNAQGKCIVNSISLKDGEEEFLRRASLIHSFGAAMVVMAFDENGQAETYERKIGIAGRCYRLLTGLGIEPHDIIFDVNVLSIGTGIPEHARFGVDFIEAVRWIKNNLPGALTSGGISNLSFAFRGQNAVREAMHSAFLYHAIRAGLDMAIVNPTMLQVYEEIDPELLECVEDVIFDRDPAATERLVAKAASLKAAGPEAASKEADAHQGTAAERLRKALVKGGSATLAEDVIEAYADAGSAIALIEGPLMQGMEAVGNLFAEGKMFLPQVVRSAKVMRDAVGILQPYMGASEEGSGRPVVVLATVKGDVHDIGKNITGIVLQCSGFEVVDLGVMVPPEDILAKARETDACIIGVSGLITPSLARMEELCRMMAEQGSGIPLFVGGAAASAIHTAVKLAPLYPDVHYGADASASAVMAKKFLAAPDAFRAEEKAAQQRIRAEYERTHTVRGGEGRRLELNLKALPSDVVLPDIPFTELGYSELEGEFDWKLCARLCGMQELDPQTKAEADERLVVLKARIAVKFSGESSEAGVFAIAVDNPFDGIDIVAYAAAACLAEAASEHLRKHFQAIAGDGCRILLPAIGYPACPDHSLKGGILARLPKKLGISLTDSFAMQPDASICGYVVASAL